MFLKIRNKLSFLLLAFIALPAIVFFGSTVRASDLSSKVNQLTNTSAAYAGFGASRDPRIIAALTVQILLGLLGSVFMVLIIMSGYWYITARGRSDMIEKATDTMRRAVIGIIVVMMAYSITYFVSQKVQQTVTKPTAKECHQSTGVIDSLFGEKPCDTDNIFE